MGGDSSMIEWSRSLGGVPIYLHGRDRAWVTRPDPAIVFWEGPTQELLPGVPLVHCGGHFAGKTLLHWQAGAEGRRALLAGDIFRVVPGADRVGFMRSYPNLIPLSPEVARRLASRVADLRFDRIHGAWWDRRVWTGASLAVHASAQRYIAWASNNASADDLDDVHAAALDQ
ncbi:MAG: hypothetical protein ACT4P7_11780 [Gemmatimonadaceae bacterium]